MAKSSRSSRLEICSLRAHSGRPRLQSKCRDGATNGSSQWLRTRSGFRRTADIASGHDRLASPAVPLMMKALRDVREFLHRAIRKQNLREVEVAIERMNAALEEKAKP